MNELKIGILEDQAAFRPGELLRGGAGWQVGEPPRSVETRLFWYTKGKGTEDVEVVATESFERPQMQDARPFEFRLPAAPYSFSGKLISLIWAVELVAQPSGDAARVEFVLSPTGHEILLHEAANATSPG
ncbi:MAG: hypothetical protein KDM81_02595 [Verrucomicrobiae bacterium]|nr:hypothetical protein [Verrucomicrobiae bacterium]MCP5521921.1 hypothetical protein [Verrucomicrobiales bacterium]